MGDLPWLAPEFLQEPGTVDCGPACLMSILDGFGIPTSYARLRAACRPDAVGTSIDRLGEVTHRFGLRAFQRVVPPRHLLSRAVPLSPSVVALREPGADHNHFVVVWRYVDETFHVMNPTVGRQWMSARQFFGFLHRHAVTIPAAAWLDWALSSENLPVLHERVSALCIGPAGHDLIAGAEEGGWRRMATIVSAIEMVDDLVEAGDVARGAGAERALRRLCRPGNENSIAEQHRVVRPAPARRRVEQVQVRGAVVLQIKTGAQRDGRGRRMIAQERNRPRRPRERALRVNPTFRVGFTYEVCRRNQGRMTGVLDTAVAEAIQAGLERPSRALLRQLRAVGALASQAELPRPVRFRAELGSRPPPLLPGGSTPGSKRAVAALVVNPRAHLQEGEEPPPSIADRIGPRDFLDPRGPIVWVDDAATGVLSPYHLAPAIRGRVEQVLGGERGPGELPASVVDLLARAHILVRPDHERRRRAAWEAICARAAAQVGRQHHVVLRGVLNPLQIAALRSYLRGIEREGYLTPPSIGDFATRKERCNEPAMRFVHRNLVPVLNRILPRPIKASFAFLGVYVEGSVLKRHRDRPQCAWNVSMALDAEPELGRRASWPLHLDIGGRPRTVRLGLGDAVLYSGERFDHWRDAQPAGHRSTFGFFCYVPRGFRKGLD